MSCQPPVAGGAAGEGRTRQVMVLARGAVVGGTKERCDHGEQWCSGSVKKGSSVVALSQGAAARWVSALRWCNKEAVKRRKRNERVNEGVNKTEGAEE